MTPTAFILKASVLAISRGNNLVKNKLYLSKISQGLALLIIDSVFFGATDPAQAPSGFFIIAFILAGFSFYWVANLLYQSAMSYGAPLRHRKRAVIYTTICLMIVVALQTVGQLSSRDIVLILPFALMAYLYISYQQQHYQNLR